MEWSAGVARNATINYVYAGLGTGSGLTCSNRTAGVFDSLQYAIDNNLAPVLSISYGNCEALIGTPAEIQSMAQLATEANSQGQTISAAAGDDGAADCDVGVTSATHGLAVDVPAAIPEVTGVGGSEFDGDAAGTVTGTAPNTNASATTYWSGTSNSTDTISSALSYIPEMAWNDTTADLVAGATSFAATGGGASKIFSKPSWQMGTGVPSDGKRDVPDVSLSASADHDGYLICEAGSCVDGFRKSAGGELTVAGGTSVSAQVFAGILAIINQATKSSQGNANPTLYSLASTVPTAYHDITTGNNIVPCTKGSTDCPSAAPFQIGFTAGIGYDRVTGLGTLEVNNLAGAWPGFSTAPVASKTTLSASASPIPVGTTVTFTVTVTSASGTGPTPTGTVQFTVDGANAGTATVGNGGQANLADSTLTLGTHQVVAVYSGDTNYLTSTSTAITEIVTGSYTLTASPTSVSANPGGEPTSTMTVATTDGFSGTVNLTCAVSSLNVEIACSLSPTSVALSSTIQTQPSTLTISTTAASSTSSLISRPSVNPRPDDNIGWFPASGGALLAGIVMIGVPSRQRRWMMLLGLVFCVFLAAGPGCGGNGSSSNTTTTTNPGTAAGTYTVTVTGTTGTSGAYTVTAKVMVIVQ